MRATDALRNAPLAAAVRVEGLEPEFVEWEARPAGAERVRQLLGGAAAESAPAATGWRFRSFEVRRVMPGRGVWLEEVHQDGSRGRARFVADTEASEVLDEGSFFGLPLRQNEPVRIPRFWVGCELCAAERGLRGGRCR